MITRATTLSVLSCLLLASCGSAPRPFATTAPPVGSAPTAPAATPLADPRAIVQLTAAFDRTCALRASGTTLCWGGAKTDRKALKPPITPVPELEGATAIDAAGGQLCGILGGKGRCVGDQACDAEPRITDAFAVSATSRSACTLSSDGIVRCWGSGDLGSGGLGASSTALPARVRDVVHLASRDDLTCALVADGTVPCWGGSLLGGWSSRRETDDDDLSEVQEHSPRPAVGVRDAMQIVLNAEALCVLSKDNSVSCGSPRGPLEKIKSLPASVRKLGSGGTAAHVCAIVDDGRVRCWGKNDFGQLGAGRSPSVAPSEAVDVPGLRNVVEVVAGRKHTCARTDTGRIFCWGANDNGHLGAARDPSRGEPGRVPGLEGVTALASNDDAFCALCEGGTVACWGGPYGSSPVPIDGVKGATSIDVGGRTSCASTREGIVMCWGTERPWTRGDPQAERRRTSSDPAPGMNDAAQVVIGSGFACALRRSGSIACWSASPPHIDKQPPQRAAKARKMGRSEAAAPDAKPRPLQASPDKPWAIKGLSNATMIATMNDRLCAETPKGVLCWRPLRDDVPKMAMPTEKLVTLVVGSQVWGVTRKGEAVSWPLDVDMDETTVGTQRRLSLSDVTDVYATRFRTCVARAKGSALCWSDGLSNVLDTHVEGALRAATARETTCVLKSDKTVVCLGSDEGGRLGRGNQPPPSAPVEIVLPD